MEKAIHSIQIKNLGPIASADVHFGDLTLFVGPQASGKSIVLQVMKLLKDKDSIRQIVEDNNFAWPENPLVSFDHYMGQGSGGIWTKATEIQMNGLGFSLDFLKVKSEGVTEREHPEIFYVPAQRVMAFDMDWLRTFKSFSVTTPFVLAHFSETIRQILESNVGTLYPVDQKLKAPVRELINNSIFGGGKIFSERNIRKTLKMNVGKQNIPFMTWSAGQKEFMPLLLAFYWLCPSSKISRKDDIKVVFVEEPEMGLHPKAIVAVLVQILDLISRGYQVVVSTHSTVFLEFAWAFRALKKSHSEDGLYKLFGLKKTQPNKRLFEGLLEKEVKTFYFDRKDERVDVRDISSLDAGNEDLGIADWGGLSSFISNAADIISELPEDE